MTPNELRKLRGRMKVTQSELAKELGVDRNTVTRWESSSGDWPIPKPMAKLIRMIAAQKRPKRRSGR